jgi:hypothetical protein
MNEDEEIPNTDEQTPRRDEKEENYEVGYGKPPKNTRFQKGASGNPSGRRKKGRDLGTELSKELNAPITINDNGKRRRISKVQGILKQLANKALTGDIRAAQTVLTYYQQVLEKAALSAAQQPGGIPEMDPRALTDGQLVWLAAQGLPHEERKKLGVPDMQ